MAEDLPTIDGYLADSAYPSNFHTPFQPAWTAWNLARRGIAPPRAGDGGFTLVDLGCGDGLGLALTAAAHPQCRFIGLDAMPEHVERGRAFARDAGVTNAAFHCATFAEAGGLADGSADFVTAQGVLAWISEDNRDALADLAAAWLKPGGALTIGYNSYPGWGQVAGFQKLVAALAAHGQGNSDARFAAAVEQARAAGVFEQSVWDWFEPMRERYPASYFAHEYLNAHWAPCWSGDVIAAMAARGLGFAGEARTIRLREDLCLPADWRKAMAAMPDAMARELAFDQLATTWYRQDIYVKLPALPLSEAQRTAWLLQSWWCLVSAAETVEFASQTPAGTIEFDNPGARAIVAALGRGPAMLGAIPGIAPPDLINAIDALYSAQLVMPVGAPSAGVDPAAFNARLAAQGQPIAALVTRHGALAMDRAGIAATSTADRQRIGLGG